MTTPDRQRCRIVFAAVMVAAVRCAAARFVPPAGDARGGMLREAMSGLLPGRAALPPARARRECVVLPVDPPNDRLAGPHGGTLIGAACVVAAFDVVGASPARWSAARYRWTSIFSAEDPVKDKSAHEMATEEEVVLFETIEGGDIRPTWHARFETGDYAIWRSITPELVDTPRGTTLLSVMSCVNGTGGCTQEFLQRHADRRWFPVSQTWFEELPHGYAGRLQHGVRIDPRTLQGEAGFYGDADPNCCPSQLLVVDLAIRGDALVLRGPPHLKPFQR